MSQRLTSFPGGPIPSGSLPGFSPPGASELSPRGCLLQPASAAGTPGSRPGSRSVSTPCSLWTCRRWVGIVAKSDLGFSLGLPCPSLRPSLEPSVSVGPWARPSQSVPAFFLPRPHLAVLPAALGAAHSSLHQPMSSDTLQGHLRVPFSAPSSPMAPDLPRQQGSDIFGFISSTQRKHLGAELPGLGVRLCCRHPASAGGIDAWKQSQLDLPQPSLTLRVEATPPDPQGNCWSSAAAGSRWSRPGEDGGLQLEAQLCWAKVFKLPTHLGLYEKVHPWGWASTSHETGAWILPSCESLQVPFLQKELLRSSVRLRAGRITASRTERSREAVLTFTSLVGTAVLLGCEVVGVIPDLLLLPTPCLS